MRKNENQQISISIKFKQIFKILQFDIRVLRKFNRQKDHYDELFN